MKAEEQDEEQRKRNGQRKDRIEGTERHQHKRRHKRQPPALFLLLFFQTVFVWHNAILSRTFSRRRRRRTPWRRTPPPFPVARHLPRNGPALATPFYHQPFFPGSERSFEQGQAPIFGIYFFQHEIKALTARISRYFFTHTFYRPREKKRNLALRFKQDTMFQKKL